MKPWRTLSKTTLLKQSPFLTVESHQVQLPDGQIIPDWAWVITPDYVNVVAVTATGQFLCFRQTKYAVARTSLAIVGGYIDAGEAALAAAQRELREETGYQADDWTPLGSYAVDGNRGSGAAHLFLAQNAYPVAAPDADDLEEQEALLLSRSEVEAALKAGEFKVLPWATALGLALLHL